MQNKYRWIVPLIGLIIALDQATKYWVTKRIRPYETIPVIKGFFNLTYVRNKGAAFSLFAGAPDGLRTAFFIAVTIAAIVIIAVLIVKTRERLMLAAYALILAGAAGNLIDRVRHGDVVDFIQWYVKTWYWPSFNVADSAITVGVALLVVDMLFIKKPEATSTKSE